MVSTLKPKKLSKQKLFGRHNIHSEKKHFECFILHTDANNPGFLVLKVSFQKKIIETNYTYEQWRNIKWHSIIGKLDNIYECPIDII